jgi:nitroreductase
MEVLEAILNRRSIRAYQDRDLPREMIEQIIEAGQWAPSSSNSQSWRFIVVQRKTQLRLIKSFSPGMIGDPPVAVVICSDQRDMADRGEEQTLSREVANASMAAQNMMLMAHSLGIGSCVIASFSEVGVREVLDLPGCLRPIFVMSLGFPAKVLKGLERKGRSKIVFWERYSEEGQG